MTEFLVVYRRSRGQLVECVEFTDRDTAVRERSAREVVLKDDRDIEVVLLSAASRDQLMRTHSRYFRTSGELAADLRDALAN